MAHITLPDGLPGIVGPLAAYPETARHLNGLAEALLRGPSSLTPAERELVATYTSRRNECRFCTQSHAAAARYLHERDHGAGSSATVDRVLDDLATAPVSDKMRALLAIAGKVQQGGRRVLPQDVARAREAGADDQAIHDTVLIAAAFCMYNRYVDGLATFAPERAEDYAPMGAALGEHGYLNPVGAPAGV
ncbi:carboxymuconolactone decarboxylase [Gemmatimonadetes bacterium T265]|nr:carboxymuconolactone decarboxylase [Gemmatimonadetes bacterium T265]